MVDMAEAMEEQPIKPPHFDHGRETAPDACNAAMLIPTPEVDTVPQDPDGMTEEQLLAYIRHVCADSKTTREEREKVLVKAAGAYTCARAA